MRDGKAEFGGELARLLLAQIAERKAQEGELLARGAEQEIALVALGVGGAHQLPAAGAAAGWPHNVRSP